MVVAVLATSLIALPAGIALGGGQTFSDVPPSHRFFADVEALAASGITYGCGGGRYCPDGLDTRGQMAAFLNRLGALASNKQPKVNADRLDGLNSTAFSRGGVDVWGNGTRNQWFNHGGGAPTVTRMAVGSYSITFPGANYGINDNLLAQVTLRTVGFATIGSGGGAVQVYTYSAAGALADKDFQLVVWDASHGG
jgi:hypothetical protein